MGIARRHARGREKGPLQIYQDVGLEVEILGPARDYWGDRRQPARSDASAAADRLRAIWGS
jgi:hypothetical protein